MKIKHLALLILPLLVSCEGENNPSITSESETESTDIVAYNELEEEVQVKLFDMHPVPELEKFGLDEEWEWASIKYFSGQIGDNNISVFLTPIYKEGEYNGRYIYTDNGISFPLTAVVSIDKDSVELIRKEGSETKEIFKGETNFGFTEISGTWYKDKDSLSFNLKEEENSAEEAQIFINLDSGGDLSNTTEGIVLIPDYGDEMFNSFTYFISDGTVGDFGEEWTDDYSQVFFEDSIIILTECSITNSVSTIFKEGHEPDGPEYNDPDGVEGIDYSTYGEITVTIIDDGVKSIQTLVVEFPFTADTWLFKNYIVLSDTDSDKTVTYKWNRVLGTFEEQKIIAS